MNEGREGGDGPSRYGGGQDIGTLEALITTLAAPPIAMEHHCGDLSRGVYILFKQLYFFPPPSLW